MYGVFHVDYTAHTVSLVPLKRIDNVPVFIEPLDPYKLRGVRLSQRVRRRTRGGHCPGRMTSALCARAISPLWMRASTSVRVAH